MWLTDFPQLLWNAKGCGRQPLVSGLTYQGHLGSGLPCALGPCPSSGKTIIDLLTMGVCPQKQGIPSPQEEEQPLEGAGRHQFLRWEGELGVC